MSADQGSKTEQATPRQRQRARQRGQVARSVELVSAVLLFSLMMLIFFLDNYYGGIFISMFRDTAGKADMVEVSGSNLPVLVRDIVGYLFRILAPFLLASVFVALMMNFIQVGMVFSAQPLNPDMGRLNPLKGFQRIFSMRSLVDFVKNILKLIIVAVVGFSIIINNAPGLVNTLRMDPLEGIALAQSIGLKIVLFCSALLFILAILDYLYQRYEHDKSIMMSKQEIKDEFKNMEGDPLIKRRIREMGRQFAMSRMMEQLKTADAIITNPTHYAVGVCYELEWPAPKVVVKGADYMALRLIRYAEELGIPVYQQPELARALFKVEPDEFVPGNLFKAVARVLAHISRFDQKLRRKLRGLKPSAVS